MKQLSLCGPALAAALLLAACGGSDSASEGAPTTADIRELIGLSAPPESPQAQYRPAEILARSNSLILSTMHGETVEAEIPIFRLLTQCSGRQCTVTEPLSGTVDTIDLANTPLRQGAPAAIGEKHDIVLIWETSTHTGAYLASLGSWMEDSSFAILNESQTGEEGPVDVWYGIALGELAGTPPAGSATWLGIMVGTPVTGDARGERLAGNAALTYGFPSEGDGSGPSLDVTFGGITNIDRGTAHTVETVLFENLAVGPDGTFATGQSGARIQGSFHGSGHAEAVGIFEQSDIVGAFGATRQ
jgi:hypothetical protein